jgi:tyrosine-protein phosphatase SIW14
MHRLTRLTLQTLVALVLIGGPIGYAWRFHPQAGMRNFRVVSDGVLYRSGQMSINGLKWAIHDHGIKTVITLRDSAYQGDPPPDQAEQDFCEAEEITYCRISPRTWWAPNGSLPAAEEGVKQFRAIMDDPKNYPVLIHCYAGIHRTGAFCAIYRMEYQGWTNAQAIAEMRSCGYKDLEDEWDLLGYLEKYTPRNQRVKE